MNPTTQPSEGAVGAAKRNIGGSILPSSDPRILAPTDCALGRLQVRAMDAEDTHTLLLNDTRIASHPNGYSCRSLAERLAVGDAKRIMEQAEYIIACGGEADLEAISRHASTQGKEGKL